jgi:hypothetical protein
MLLFCGLFSFTFQYEGYTFECNYKQTALQALCSPLSIDLMYVKYQ